MDDKATQKSVVKVTSKTSTAKAFTTDQEKVINQLKQEIRTLRKNVKEMQQKPGTQEICFRMPNTLLVKVNKYLSEYRQETDEPIVMSDFISECVECYLWADEEDSQAEEKLGQDGQTK